MIMHCVLDQRRVHWREGGCGKADGSEKRSEQFRCDVVVKVYCTTI
jgi:hypothetical protein